MTTFEKQYTDYFIPLIEQFVRKAELLPHPDIKRMPEPMLPLFGRNYETSPLKLVVIGQDTRGWGDVREFIAEEKATPGIKLQEGLSEFRDHFFTSDGRTTRHFWGFAMEFLAAIHGQPDWKVMKHGQAKEILDSFAWGEVNAVELFSSKPVKMGIPWDYWNQVRIAGEHINRFRHIIATLRPNAALILCKGQGFNRETYFEGCRVEIVSENGRFTHYRLPEDGVDVFHAPHPKSMGFIEGVEHFSKLLHESMLRNRIAICFPQFLTSVNDNKEVTTFLLERSPALSGDFDKFDFVAWVADEMKKRTTFMSAPALFKLANAKG